MIELPRRSVTRFFIPLIDVLTLLFCIFLLMPIVKNVEPGEGALAGETGRIGTEPSKSGAEGSPSSSALALQRRIDVQVLEIDGRNGKLYTFTPEPTLIDSEQKARRLIADRRKRAAGKEVYFLLLYPRQDSGYPERGQVEQYETWFAGVAHKIDNPRGGR